MPSSPPPADKLPEAQALAQAIRESESEELARSLVATDDRHLFGANEFKTRDIAHKVAARAVEQHLARKNNGYQGASVACPHCGQAAEFHPHRSHTPTSLVGPVRYRRAYYLCRRCGQGLFPFDQQAGLTRRDLTPGLERVTALAGAVAGSFDKGADLLHEMAGTRLGESTPQRTAQGAGGRAVEGYQAGKAFGLRVVWPWHKGYKGRRTAYAELDATGVRQQGPGGGAAEGRMAYVGMVCNPCPEWPWPGEKRQPLRARDVAGLYALEAVGPLLRKQAGQVGMGEADCRVGLTDGGNGLEGRLEENFPLLGVVTLDFYRPAEKLTGLARLLYPQDEARSQGQARAWCRPMKEEGGALLAAVLREWEWPPRRPGLVEAVAEVVGYLERQAHRMGYPEYQAEGWCIGSGAVEGACKAVVGQRLKLAGMRRGEDGADALCHLRALYRSEKGQWEAFWNRDDPPD